MQETGWRPVTVEEGCARAYIDYDISCLARRQASLLSHGGQPARSFPHLSFLLSHLSCHLVASRPSASPSGPCLPIAASPQSDMFCASRGDQGYRAGKQSIFEGQHQRDDV